MLRTHRCGELRSQDIEKEVTLCGWVQRRRDLGGMTFIDLRDRSGITQLAFYEEINADLLNAARELGREYVLKVTGKVQERSSKNSKISTGDIEVVATAIEVLNAAEVPPFTIEEESDGGDELRMKYRYLDLRRTPLQRNLELRHKTAQIVRKYLDAQQFLELETPFLIKSTPEGARDFIVPSRLNEGQFYALPQSPQTFKQLFMVAGYDRYFQIVKCFRDEDLRADRQPEFTQIDCELSFVEREDILQIFEGLMREVYQETIGKELPDFQRLSFADAMKYYGSDKPDLRFDMQFCDLTETVQGQGFKVFDAAECALGIVVPGGAEMTRKQLDSLTDFVRSQQIGAKGLVWCKFNADGSAKSAVDKFYDAEQLARWKSDCKANDGDLLLLMSGGLHETRKQLGELRLEVARRNELIPKDKIAPLWVLDFPLVEWDEETQRWYAMHHPFTSPNINTIEEMDQNPGEITANAYDMVINGVEIGGGSIRIHNAELQQKMFELLGFTPEEAEAQFGFLLKAFKYGAPPHGGIAFGFDRLVAMLTGEPGIRDVMAFPKNNLGRDVMLDAPAAVDNNQLDELSLKLK